jgi:hypothetical protein
MFVPGDGLATRGICPKFNTFPQSVAHRFSSAFLCRISEAKRRRLDISCDIFDSVSELTSRMLFGNGLANPGAAATLAGHFESASSTAIRIMLVARACQTERRRR